MQAPDVADNRKQMACLPDAVLTRTVSNPAIYDEQNGHCALKPLDAAQQYGRDGRGRCGFHSGRQVAKKTPGAGSVKIIDGCKRARHLHGSG